MNGSINDSAAQQQRDEKFMRMAINEARQALKREEVPIGAVVVAGDRVVGRGHNLVETLQDATAHAEMQALTAASSTLGGKYLRDCTLYVTVEPCVMCAGAIAWSQAARVVWGADDPKRVCTIPAEALLLPVPEARDPPPPPAPRRGAGVSLWGRCRSSPQGRRA